MKHRLGVDFGGTKIEIIALAGDGTTSMRKRVANPGSYNPALQAVRALVDEAEAALQEHCPVGVGIPGAINPISGRVHNANSVWLNDRPFAADLSAVLGRPVQVENDANCFALSEASDGAGAGHDVVFGVILGTGCGGAIVAHGRLLPGLHRMAGEWGHTPLPYLRAEDHPSPPCFCGRAFCLERYIAGPSLAADFHGPGARDASGIPGLAASGDPAARAALDRHADRVARGLSVVITLLDPDVIVLGGGLSNMAHLYDAVPALLPRYVLGGGCRTRILRNVHGDSSGVRGAAWLWPLG